MAVHSLCIHSHYKLYNPMQIHLIFVHFMAIGSSYNVLMALHIYANEGRRKKDKFYEVNDQISSNTEFH